MNPGDQQAGPREDDVRAELARILASARFSVNPSLSRFLRHAVEVSLGGKHDMLKEYSIGMAVFHRGERFDPRIDPIVRVQAGRLRARLRQYYESEGHNSPVVIELQRGSYVPSFRYRETLATLPREGTAAPAAGKWLRRKWLIPVLFAAGVTGAVLWRLTPRTGSELPPPPVQLTAAAGRNIFPSISRDGRLVVYSSDRSGNGDLNLWVQPVAGGDAVRLTSTSGSDITPDFSPDGTQIVYRSRRKAGGLYVVSVFGGAERRLSVTGWRPRYSPDGKSIAFNGESKRPGGDLFIVPAAGGEAKLVDIGSSVHLGGVPVWSPDGTHLIFSGYDERRRWDFWAAPRGGGRPVPVGLAGQLRRQGLGELDQETVPGDWIAGDLVFALVQQGVANLWRAPLSRATWRIAGPLRRITSGSALELSPRVSGNGRIVFSGDHHVTHLFSLPTSSPGAEPQQLTADASLRPGHFRAPVRFSAGRRFLVYPSRRAGTQDIVLRDLASGSESLLAATAEAEQDPLLSPDETAAVYTVGSSMWLVETGNRLPRKLCAGCGPPLSWLPDSKRVLLNRGKVGHLAVHVLNVASAGPSAEWLADPEYSFSHAVVSPDGRWAALSGVSVADASQGVWVARMENDRPVARTRWVPVRGAAPESALQWDPNSIRLYFFSSRDGYRCLWSFAWNGRGAGALEEIRHWGGGRVRPWNSWLWVGGDRLVFELTESSSNVFLIDPAGGRVP